MRRGKERWLLVPEQRSAYIKTLMSSARDYYYGKQCGLFTIVLIEQVVDCKAQEAGHKTNASLVSPGHHFIP